MKGFRLIRGVANSGLFSAASSTNSHLSPVVQLAIHRKYSNVLQTAAIKPDKLDLLEDDLKRITLAIDSDEKFKDLILSKSINLNDKKSTLNKLLNEQFAANELTMSIVNSMIEKDLLKLLLTSDFRKIISNLRDVINDSRECKHAASLPPKANNQQSNSSIVNSSNDDRSSVDEFNRRLENILLDFQMATVRNSSISPDSDTVNREHATEASTISDLQGIDFKPEEVTLNRNLVASWLKLSKFRLTSLVVLTALTGHYMGMSAFDPQLMFFTLLGTGLCSSSAAALNQFLEIPYDSQMSRTKSRPLVTHNVTPLHAFSFAVLTGISGVALLATNVNTLTASLGALNLLLYSFIYTPMKRFNIVNTWIGSIVGAIPPVMGYTAATGHIGVLINKQTNDSVTVEFTRLAVDSVNREFSLTANSTSIQINPIIEVLSDTSPVQVVDALGKLLEQRIVALISTLERPLHRIVLSYSNVFQVPLIHLDQTQNSFYVPGLYQLSIKPSYLNSLAAIIQHFDWKNIIYLYNSEDAKLQTLFSILIRKKFDWKLEKIKQFKTSQDAHDFILSLELEDPKAHKYILLDCDDADLAQEIIVKHVNNIYLGRRNFHFLFTSLIIDNYWFKATKEFGAINITGLRIIDPLSPVSREIFARLNLVAGGKLLPLANRLNLEMALIFDSLAAVFNAIVDLVSNKDELLDSTTTTSKTTTSNYEYLMSMISAHNSNSECKNYLKNEKTTGQLLHKYLRYVKFNGFTGNVEFSGNIYRQNYKINIVSMTLSSEMTTYASYSEKDGSLVVVPSKLYRQANRKRFERRHVIITSILEEPYLMWRKGDTIADQIYEGNDRFEGYCKDLADLLMSTMNLTYTLKLVNDSKYGAEDSKSPLGWNGMVGELIRKEADLAIAPLTITSARERVIDSTKPFMETGISIMIKRPKKKYSDIFSFLNPLSVEIWIYIIISYIGVSLVIFTVGKCSQKEWQKGSIGVYQDRFLDDFTLFNCFWFSIGAMLRQNSEISPRSLPARIAGGSWWFFNLIIISSYTANLAAFLTVERMITPINSADDLSKQTSIEYGILRDSSTQEFFKNSKVQVYRTTYSFMISRPHVLLESYTEGINRVRNSNGKFAFLLESTKNEYINNRRPCDTLRIGRNLDAKGYGIATPLNSVLTVELNLKILMLQESSDLAKLENKWWFERSECKSIDRNIDINQNSLSLTNVTGCFYILFCGLGLAFIVSLIEYYLFKKNYKVKKQNGSKKGLDDKSISLSIRSGCPVHDRLEFT